MDERERTIWIMNLLRDGVSNFEFCRERDIVGIGWGLCEHTTTDYDEYKELTKLEGRYYKDGQYDDNLKVAMEYFEAMDEGDLILLHDRHMTFYVCEVLDKEIDVNQGALYFEANATCNKRVKYLDVKIKEAELQALGLERSDYIARKTIKKLPSSSEGKELVKYINKKCILSLS